MSVSKRVLSSMHATVDELAKVNPEAISHLSSLLETLLGTAAAIDLPKRGKKTDDDDIVDDEPKRGRGRPAKAKDDDDDIVDEKPRRGRPAKVTEEEEGSEEDDSNSSEELDDLEAASIVAFFDACEAEEHDSISGGLKEMEASFLDLTSDSIKPVSFYKRAKANTPAEKRNALKEFLARAFTTIDAITDFEMESVVEAVHEISGEDEFEPEGRGKAAKELSAATELFKVAFVAE